MVRIIHDAKMVGKLLLFSVLWFGVSGKNVVPYNFTSDVLFPLYLNFEPPAVGNLSMWDGVESIRVEYKFDSPQTATRWMVKIVSDDTDLTTLKDSNGTFFLDPVSTTDNMTGGTFNFSIHGHFLGFTKLKIYVANDTYFAETNLSYWREVMEYPVTVIRPQRKVDVVFMVAIAILVVVGNVMMGSKIDLTIVKDVLRRPYSPIIGFCTQFLIMPPLAFGLSRALGLNPSQSIGLFASGCAPGGGASNMYTYLLKGDLSLSITMTLISTIASLGMIPLWMFTLGNVVIREIPNMQIPYENICITLVSIIAPVGVGVLLQKKAPKFTKKLGKCIRPFLIILILFMTTFGSWVNMYIFRLFTPKVLVAGMLLPWTGFALGGLIPTIFRRPKNRILTIAIETGIQNTGVPIMLLLFSLESPQGDLAIVAPIAQSMFTPLPLLFAIAVFETHKRCCKKRSKETKDDEDEIHPDLEEDDATTQQYSVDGRYIPAYKAVPMKDISTNQIN
ncbi:ileal sodium/bile acid cotransporter-like [Tubulanus polymorphus]|uniref:ileal sodium/bile acid cotransporter-like n=1 Tax=Tubulanus polymorphus TaxID=672921 RepID=UPI003DA467FE